MSVWWFYISRRARKGRRVFSITYHAGAGVVASYATTRERRDKTSGKRKSIPAHPSSPYRGIEGVFLYRGDEGGPYWGAMYVPLVTVKFIISDDKVYH